MESVHSTLTGQILCWCEIGSLYGLSSSVLRETEFILYSTIFSLKWVVGFQVLLLAPFLPEALQPISHLVFMSIQYRFFSLCLHYVTSQEAVQNLLRVIFSAYCPSIFSHHQISRFENNSTSVASFFVQQLLVCLNSIWAFIDNCTWVRTTP